MLHRKQTVGVAGIEAFLVNNTLLVFDLLITYNLVVSLCDRHNEQLQDLNSQNSYDTV